MIAVIAGATARESMRSRSFLVLIALYGVGVLLAPVMAWISATDGRIIVSDIVFSLLSIIGVLVAVATGTALVHSEIKQRTLYTVLSRPLPRWKFVVGKYLGLCASLICGQAAMLCVGLIALYLYGADVHIQLVWAGLLVMVEVCLLAAVSLALTSLAGPLLAAALSLAVYALGHAVHELPHYMHHLEAWQATIAIGLASLIPDLGGLAFRNDAVHHAQAGWQEVLYAIYGLAWMCLLLNITVIVYRRKQL